MRIDTTTATTVMMSEFMNEWKKSVTWMASMKLSRDQALGRDRIPAMSLVISEGSLKAMTTAM